MLEEGNSILRRTVEMFPGTQGKEPSAFLAPGASMLCATHKQT